MGSVMAYPEILLAFAVLIVVLGALALFPPQG